MNKTPGSKQFWRVCGPILLYWGITVVAQIITGCILVIFNAEEIAEIMLIGNNPTDAEMEAALMSVTASMTEVILKYYVEISAVTSLCTIPMTVYLFKMDRKNEVQMNTPVNKKAPLGKYIWIPILGCAVCFGFNCLILMTDLAFLSESYVETSSLFYSASFPVQIVCIGVITPLAEELLFRGIIFKRLREHAGFKVAALCASLFFATIHGSMIQMVYTLILGMFLAYVYEKYGSFKAPVLLHISVNVISLVCTELKILDLLYVFPMAMAVSIIICAFIGAVMFVQIQKIDEKPIVQSE